MAIREQKFTKTPFRRQAGVISALLRTNPIINEDEKQSLTETVGVLTWLNQLQLHWATGKTDLPDSIKEQIFSGRTPERLSGPEPSR